MASVNKVILVGNLGRDPELKYTPSGAAVVNFTLATNDKWKDKEGNKQEHTEWHRIVAWNKLAEICGEYLHKGRQVYIEGSIRSRTYKDREGRDKTVTEIRAGNMVMLGRGGDSLSNSSRDGDPGPAPSEGASENSAEYDDDIPF